MVEYVEVRLSVTSAPTNQFRWCLPRSTTWERPKLQQAWRDTEGSIEWRNVPFVNDHDAYYDS